MKISEGNQHVEILHMVLLPTTGLETETKVENKKHEKSKEIQRRVRIKREV